MKLINTLFLLLAIAIFASCNNSKKPDIICGADQPERYLPLLKNKSVALVVNHTSILISNNHLLDFLINNQVNIHSVFAPEHGFRGDADAGETINDSIDIKTGVKINSLYGSNKKPTKNQLKDVDIILFDIQDVGCRFYTYLSTLHYVMEACAQNRVELIILDRPNPNGDYIAGPVLNLDLKSFVGMHPIPVVHGCTLGEMGKMINGENWLKDGKQCKLTVIKIKNWAHHIAYKLPVKPSPNLPNYQSVRLYPSLCFFEATQVSIGRGTIFPFQVIGYPDTAFGNYNFTPQPIPGMSKKPTHENQKCYGIDLRYIDPVPSFTLKYFIDFRNKFKNPNHFWKSTRWIELLSGSKTFYKKIESGLSEKEITKSWEEDLIKYKTIRKKYLLYPDFE